jgi:hypothetical protein
MFQNLVINNKCENLTNEIVIELPYQFLGYNSFKIDVLRFNVNEYDNCLLIKKDDLTKTIGKFNPATMNDYVFFDHFQYKETKRLPIVSNICYVTSPFGDNNTLIKDLFHNIDNINCNLVSYGLIKNKSCIINDSDWINHKDEKLTFNFYTDEWNKLPISDYFIIVKFQYDNKE